LYDCPQYETFVFMELQRKFGKILKELRLEKNLSQESLAFESGIDRTYIGDIEKGERNISLQIVSQLSQALQISLSDFLKKIETNGEIE
jgi:transcriptional regulator with XRE-family HTH domain